MQIYNTLVYLYHHIYKIEMTEHKIHLILITHFVQIIAYLSSALNPFIYSYMSEAFRNNLKLELSNCCCSGANSPGCFKSKSRKSSTRESFRRSFNKKEDTKTKMLSPYFMHGKTRLSMRDSRALEEPDMSILNEESQYVSNQVWISSGQVKFCKSI